MGSTAESGKQMPEQVATVTKKWICKPDVGFLTPLHSPTWAAVHSQRNMCLNSLRTVTQRRAAVHSQENCAGWLQVVQSQESDAAEMADQLQQLEGDRAHLQVVSQDLDLAEDRVSGLAPILTP